jgi:hypothetical protein
MNQKEIEIATRKLVKEHGKVKAREMINSYLQNITKRVEEVEDESVKTFIEKDINAMHSMLMYLDKNRP